MSPIHKTPICPDCNTPMHDWREYNKEPRDGQIWYSLCGECGCSLQIYTDLGRRDKQPRFATKASLPVEVDTNKRQAREGD